MNLTLLYPKYTELRKANPEFGMLMGDRSIIHFTKKFTRLLYFPRITGAK
jgi:hypothetical protein